VVESGRQDRAGAGACIADGGPGIDSVANELSSADCRRGVDLAGAIARVRIPLGVRKCPGSHLIAIVERAADAPERQATAARNCVVASSRPGLIGAEAFATYCGTLWVRPQLEQLITTLG